MDAETVRELLRRQPFEPFRIRMTNGDEHLIRHPELAMLAGGRLVVHVVETDRLVILSLLNMAAIELNQATT